MTITEFLLARIAYDEALVLDDSWDRQTRARVLAECAAKRAIVEAFDPDDLRPGSARGRPFYATGVADCLMALASVYKDHPDYQEAWRA